MPLLEELASLAPPLFVFGGIAEEALLDGTVSDSHGDVDVLIGRDEYELRASQLELLGFNDFAVYHEPLPGRPLVLGSSRGDHALELSMVDHDEGGNPFFVVGTANGPVAISVPHDLFDWPPTLIDDVLIHTLSPLALIQIRAGATATGVFGPARPDRDEARQARLIQAFFPDRDADSLMPRIAAIAST
jgi:hypothetical protein